MKRLAIAAVLVLVPVLLVACGGGGSSGNNEEEWAAEIQSVMKEGGKADEAAQEQIAAATTRKGLESDYRSYANSLGTIASKLRGTEAPAACSSVKSHVIAFMQELGSITGELGKQSSMSEKQYDSLVKEEGAAVSAFEGMMDRIGSKGHC